MTKIGLAERIKRVEDLLSNAYSASGAAALLSVEWDCEVEDARELVDEVLSRWLEEGKGGRDGRREQIRHRLRSVYRAAMERRKLAAYKTAGIARIYIDPDISAALRATEMEARLDGLLEPSELRDEGGADLGDIDTINRIRGVYGMPPVEPEEEPSDEGDDDDGG